MSRRKQTPDDLDWQTSPPETLLKTPIGRLVSSSVHAKRTGTSRTFYRFDFPDWVNIVALTQDRQIVLIRQCRFGTGQLETEIPGGMIEKGESPLEAGLRELLEETGYGGGSARIIGNVCPNPALQDNRCYTVLAENVEKIQSPALDDMEDIEVILQPEASLLEMIQSGQLSHGLVLNGIFFSLLTAGKVNFT